MKMKQRTGDIGRLLRDFGHIPLTAGCVGFALLSTVRDLACIITVADTTNAMLQGESLWLPLFWMMVAMFINAPIQAGWGYCATGLRAHVQLRGMQAISSKLVRLPLAWLADQKTGDIVSTSTSDLDRFTHWVNRQGPQFLRQIVYMVGALGYSLSQNVPLTICVFPAAALMMPLLTKITKPLDKISQAQRSAAASTLSQTQEMLSDPEFIKAYSLQDTMQRRIGDALDKQMRAEQKASIFQGISQGFGNLGSYLPGFIAAGAGVFFLLRGQVTPGFLVGFVQMTVQRFSSMAPQFAWLASSTRQASASAKRLCSLLYAEEERDDGQRALPEAGADAPVFEVRDVSFGYKEGSRVLDEITLTVKEGETVALVGASGGGKSTLFSLLMGVYSPDKGQILCMGRPLPEWNPSALRSLMAPVFQDSFLFPATIRENVAGSDSGQEVRVRAALENAGLLSFAESLPEGLDTVVAERGESLSGGQRQRLTIARAFYKDAPILLFDEPTSALDAVTEAQFQSVYRALKRGRTTLVVAHRLRTIRDADRIYVLEHGRVVQQGRHDDLIAQEGVYRRLYERQVSGEAETTC